MWLSALLFPGLSACRKTPVESAGASDPPTPAPVRTADEMASWFEPPAQFAGDFGTYRSPLIFDDGTPVKSAADWPRRKAEIRQRWEEITGVWPDLIDAPNVEVLETKSREGFTQKRIRLEISPHQKAEAYLLLPQKPGRLPAVFIPGVEPETSIGLGKPLRDLGYQLTKRGFVTLSIGVPGGNPRKAELIDANCEPLWFLAYIGANCANALAHMPEVDPNRIGIAGHAYGGKWALFSSCLYDRFACAVWSEAGIVFDERRSGADYWNPWYLGAPLTPQRALRRREEEEWVRAGAYRTLWNRRMNLTDLHALMAPRPFLVSAGSNRRPSWAANSADDETRWTALNHSIAVNHLLGYEHRVAMTNRPGHEPTTQSNEQIIAFLQRFLGLESGSENQIVAPSENGRKTLLNTR